jgi:hypothetical protein
MAGRKVCADKLIVKMIVGAANDYGLIPFLMISRRTGVGGSPKCRCQLTWTMCPQQNQIASATSPPARAGSPAVGEAWGENKPNHRHSDQFDLESFSNIVVLRPYLAPIAAQPGTLPATNPAPPEKSSSGKTIRKAAEARSPAGKAAGKD